MNWQLLSLVLTFLMLPLSAEGTSYAAPERREINSPNGKFLLVVDPETEKHIIRATSNPETEIWSFSHGVWHFPFLLSNDGRTVAVLAWRHVKEDSLVDDNCVTFYRQGTSKIGVLFSNVYPNPPKTSHVGIRPIGIFWRTWYHDVEQDGDLVTIVTTGGGSAVFDLNKRALVNKSWVGFRKPMNLFIGGGVTIFMAGGVWFFRRRSRERAEKGVGLA